MSKPEVDEIKERPPRSRRLKRLEELDADDDAWSTAPQAALRIAMQNHWDIHAAGGKPMQLSAICAAEDWRIPAGEVAVRRLFVQRLGHANLTKEQANSLYKVKGSLISEESQTRNRTRGSHYE